MSQSTLKVNELHEDADFDENSTETEIFDEKALVDDEPTESELADDELLAQGVTPSVCWMRRNSILVKSVIRHC